MSPDEVERTMQFLLTQQAQFAADMATLEGETHQIAEGLIGLTSIVGRVTDSVSHLAEAQAQTDRRLAEADARAKEVEARFAEADARLTDQIKTVESHLDIVVEMFERRVPEEAVVRA